MKTLTKILLLIFFTCCIIGSIGILVNVIFAVIYAIQDPTLTLTQVVMKVNESKHLLVFIVMTIASYIGVFIAGLTG